jgi:hypothetical protein
MISHPCFECLLNDKRKDGRRLLETFRLITSSSPLKKRELWLKIVCYSSWKLSFVKQHVQEKESHDFYDNSISSEI